MAPIQLARTFTEFSDSSDTDDDWRDFLGTRRGSLTWASLKEMPVIVVLGEAGIGKTVELALQAQRLREDGGYAFFLPLNQLQDQASWDLALGDSGDDYERWRGSNKPATVFLDAIDESRLGSHADFDRALAVVQIRLREQLNRVSFVLSSRPSDWSVEGVQASVRTRICLPLEKARAPSNLPDLSDASGSSVPSSKVAPAEAVEAFVVSLDALSTAEAKRLANTFAVQEPGRFWASVDDGSYEFMASRPLDLRWLVELWNAKRELGIFCDLLENSISNRLAELNPNYVAAGVVPSLDRLREGAEQLAAAAELSGRGYVALTPVTRHREDEVSISESLEDWKPDEAERLLAAAVFDEASYGRVRFHHRTMRAYLAASWAKRQLEAGVPLSHLTSLFISAPFGRDVLIRNRRWMLCWLAAIDVRVRDWVVRHYPEMLMFDGDPQAWDQPTADAAFLAYFDALKQGDVPDWHNSEAEYRRLGLRLSPGLIARLLSEEVQAHRARYALFSIVKHARLDDCAGQIFGVYRNPNALPRERRLALEVLETVASSDHKATITDDLVRGIITSNGLIAAALVCSNWQTLDQQDLRAIFERTENEESYSNGSMATVVKSELLPTASASSAELLLSAVLASLPRPGAGRRFARFPESEQPDRAWLLEVLPDCFERLLELLPPNEMSYPDVCLEAAERLEALRDTGFTDREEFSRIRAAIERHRALRWRIALEIAKSEDITHSIGRLSWGMTGIVNFDGEDADELVERANDPSLEEADRAIWFAIAYEVAFRYMRGKKRRRVLNALCTGPESAQRTEIVRSQRQHRCDGLKRQRTWNSENIMRRRDASEALVRNRDKLMHDIEGIRAGTSLGGLQWLVHFSYDRSDRKSLSKVDYGVIASTFGDTVATALRQGLRVVSETTEPPAPSEYRDGRIPWLVILGLAGFNSWLEDDGSIKDLRAEIVARAARFAAWEAVGAPAWFADLARTHLAIVEESLRPWIAEDAKSAGDFPTFRGGLRLALHSASQVRSALLTPLKPLVTEDGIPHPQSLKDIVKAMRADAVLRADEVIAACRTRLEASASAEGLLAETYWLRAWLEEDAVSALAWIEGRTLLHPATASRNVVALAKVAVDFKWLQSPASAEEVSVLESLYRLLARYRPNENDVVSSEDLGTFGEPVVNQVRGAIPGLLVQTPGSAAHRALKALAVLESDVEAFSHIQAQVEEHAAREAALAEFPPADVKRLATPFAFEPRSEEQLFVQVVSRLQEIGMRTKMGPFSDRALFRPTMSETALQNWLAARLYEQPNRKYSVAREEEVDNDKMPDIQAAVAAGKVCIEIKPLSRKHAYSAASLTETLRTQIGEQYLRGLNSRHGILVLFRLDDKEWAIPGGGQREPHAALVAYLQEQASAIRERSDHITALEVLLIDCVPPIKA